jgi:hypothetical protein
MTARMQQAAAALAKQYAAAVAQFHLDTRILHGSLWTAVLADGADSDPALDVARTAVVAYGMTTARVLPCACVCACVCMFRECVSGVFLCGCVGAVWCLCVLVCGA